MSFKFLYLKHLNKLYVILRLVTLGPSICKQKNNSFTYRYYVWFFFSHFPRKNNFRCILLSFRCHILFVV